MTDDNRPTFQRTDTIEKNFDNNINQLDQNQDDEETEYRRNSSNQFYIERAKQMTSKRASKIEIVGNLDARSATQKKDKSSKLSFGMGIEKHKSVSNPKHLSGEIRDIVAELSSEEDALEQSGWSDKPK